TVQLMSDVNRVNKVSAVIHADKQEIAGLVEGYDKEGKYLLFKGLSSNAQVKKGQIVVTDGLGGVFPSNLVIGKVEQVKMDEFGLTKVAYIKPSANFYDINHVIIVKRLA